MKNEKNISIPIKICTTNDLKEFQESPIKFVSNLHDEFKDIVEVKMGEQSYIFPFNAHYVKRVIEEKEVGRSSFSRIFAPIAGGSLILNDGEKWEKQRKMVAPFFFLPKIDVDKIEKIAVSVLEKWEDAIN